MNNNHKNSHALPPLLSADQEAAVRATRMSLADLAEAPPEMLKDFYAEEGFSARQKILVHSAIKIYKESLAPVMPASAPLSFRSSLLDASSCSSAASFQAGKFSSETFNPRHPSLMLTPSIHSDTRSSFEQHFLPVHQFQRSPELNSYTHNSCSHSQAHGTSHTPALPFAQSPVALSVSSLPVPQGCASFEPTQTSATPATFVPPTSIPSPVLLIPSPKAPPLERTQTPIFPTHLQLPNAASVSQTEPLLSLESTQPPDPATLHIVQEPPAVVQEPPPIMQEPPPVVQQPSAIVQESPHVVQESPTVVKESLSSPKKDSNSEQKTHLEGILNAFDRHQAEANKVQESEKSWREAHGVLPSLVDFGEFPERPERTAPETREQTKKRLAAEIEMNFPASESQKVHCHKVESIEDPATSEDMPIEYVCNLCEVKFATERAATIHASTKKHLTNVAIDNGRTLLQNGKEGWRCSLCSYQSGSVDFLRAHLHAAHGETFGGQKPTRTAAPTDRVTRLTPKSSVSYDKSELGDTSPDDNRRRSKREWTPSQMSLQSIASKERMALPIIASPPSKVPSKPKAKKRDDAVATRGENVRSRKQAVPDKTPPKEDSTPSGNSYFSALLDGLQKHLQNEASPETKVKLEAV